MHRKPIFLLLAALGALVLLVPGAMAGSTGAVGDDPANNTAPYIGPQATADGGCDTLDPTLTINRNFVAYKCIGFTNPATGQTEKGIANLTSGTLETIPTGVSIDPDDGGPKAVRNVPGPVIHVQWVTQGSAPNPGAETLIEGVHGFTFTVYYQNPVAQNRRQNIGSTIDCARYAHMGPYLTGNNEYIVLFYELVFNDIQWEENILFAHYDPVGLTNWAFVADQDSDGLTPAYDPYRYRTCSGAVPGPILNGDPGTQAAAHVTPGPPGVIDLYVPMNFHWIDNQLVPLTYQLMVPGTPVNSIHWFSASVIDAATTPQIGSFSPQGVSFEVLLDWIPWLSYDLGVFTPQTQALPGPSCANFNALEYTPGGAKNAPSGTYAPFVKGPQGQDRDTQVNPLFGSPGGLDHYDSSGEPGFTFNDIRSQDHLGPTSCSILLPLVSGNTGSGASMTA